MSKIRMTGGAGKIGPHIVDLFLAHEYDVAIVDDLSIKYALNFNPSAGWKILRSHRG